jgi:AcrR family transcriptional regulator
MASGEGVRPGGRPKVGRPPRINREMIAEAAHELGLDGLTLRDVADHLGVSIAALYHHVSSKDDLMRVAAELSATKVPLPEDRGQHWAVWLYEWATYNRDAFLAQPGLLAQFLEGAISAEAIAGNIDTILGPLVRHGFAVLDANAAFEAVSTCALGTAVSTIRQREADRAGRPVLASQRQVLAQAGPDELPYLRQVLDAGTEEDDAAFHRRIATVLCGIAVRQGEDWPPIERLIDALAPGGDAAPGGPLVAGSTPG